MRESSQPSCRAEHIVVIPILAKPLDFAEKVDPEEIRTLEPDALVELATQKAKTAYDAKEAEYPVMAGLYRFSARTPSGPSQSRAWRRAATAAASAWGRRPSRNSAGRPSGATAR